MFIGFRVRRLGLIGFIGFRVYRVQGFVGKKSAADLKDRGLFQVASTLRSKTCSIGAIGILYYDYNKEHQNTVI